MFTATRVGSKLRADHPKTGVKIACRFTLIAAANPMTMLPYLAIAAVPQTGSPLITSRGLAAPIGVMIGSASWYLALALSANTMFRNLRKATLDRLNILAGIVLIGLGATLCAPIAAYVFGR